MAGGDPQLWPRRLQKGKKPQRAVMAPRAPPAEEEDPRVRRGLALAGTQGGGRGGGPVSACDQEGGVGVGRGQVLRTCLNASVPCKARLPQDPFPRLALGDTP